jgi:hypothetical protein
MRIPMAAKNRYGIIGILFAGMLFQSGFVFSQSNSWRARADQVVQLADSLSLMSQYTFHLKKFDKSDRSFGETWHYTLNGKEVIIFEVNYFMDSIEHDEVYYLDDGQLICMEEYEISNPYTDDDEIVWGSVSFFARQSLLQHISLGKPDNPKGNYQAWDAHKKFRGRYKELLQNRSLMEGNSKDAIFAP